MKTEGDFQKRPLRSWHAGQRANIIKRGDNLFLEGEFQKRPIQTWSPAEKVVAVKRVDHLLPGGGVSGRYTSLTPNSAP